MARMALRYTAAGGGSGSHGGDGGEGTGGRGSGDRHREGGAPHSGGDQGNRVDDGGLVLALDAGSPVVSAAVGRGGETLAARSLPHQRSSTQLLALAAEALAAAGARPADLAGVVALAGPGSFTGLRVGLATALGFHQALGVRAQAVPTLDALAAASAAPAGSLVIGAVDALRGEWSARAFRVGGPAPAALGEMALLPGAELVRRLAPRAAARETPAGTDAGAEGEDAAHAAPAGTIEVIAFGVETLREMTPAAERAGVRFSEAPPLAPVALLLAAALPPAHWRAASLAAPIYSRPPATTAPRPRAAVSPAAAAAAAEPSGRR
jgi:tRNA threonylcarbamoyladenosine biosynthesis protein TsaB